MNWYQVASLIVGYALASMFSSYVSLTFSLTVWESFWTHIVLAFWGFITWLILIAIFGGGVAEVGLALAGIVVGLAFFERCQGCMDL